MTTEVKDNDVKRSFQPLIIVGVFWSVFGVVVLFATLFVRETAQVPLLRGVVTNLIAGTLLLCVGVISILRGRASQKSKRFDY